MPFFLLAALAAIWGTAFLFTRVALEGLPPVVLVVARIAVAALALNALRALVGLRLPRDGVTWLRFLPLALTGTALPFLLVSWGQEEIPSGLAGVLMAVTPLAAAALAHFALPTEPLTGRKVVGVLLGLGGVVVLIGPEHLTGLGTRENLARQAAVLAGALAYGANTVLARRLPPLHPLVYASGVTLLGALLAAPFATLSPAFPLAVDAPALWSAVWLGLVPTGLATILHYRLVRLSGAGFASLTNFGVPVIALAAGAAAFGERIDPGAIAGLGLILLGIATARDDGKDAAAGSQTRRRTLREERVGAAA